MEKFVLQWHITHKCNLRCKHCYQEDYKNELTKEDYINIFNQFKEFINKYNYRGHINFTGGEPFLSKEIFSLLDLCENNNITFGILTNGTLLNKELVNKLANYKKVSFVQVSIDGTKDIHDDIRGIGNFDKAMVAIKLLRKKKIQTMVSFTCHKDNYKYLKDVIKLMRKNKVDRFWTDRLVPFGSNEKQVLNTDEYMEFVNVLTKESNRKFSKMIVHTNRAMQWCGGNPDYYKCSAGTKLLTILADGTLLPCRRLPITLGNVLKNNMIDIYENSDVIKELQRDEIPFECSKCIKRKKCRGGAKCLSYALYSTYNKKDYNCPIKSSMI